MAISVAIPKEITEYEEKIMFGMSFRKIICFGLAVILGIVSYILYVFLFKISMDIASYIIILQAMPLMAIGFIKKDGINFEEYIVLFLRYKLGNNKLYYEPELIIDLVNEKEKNNEIPKENIVKKQFIFKREKTNENITKAESIIFKNNRKNRKRKHKEVLSEIKRAKQEYKSAKFRKEKEIT